MDQINIIGILLVRNEERYLSNIIGNIVEFCDRIIVADNNSTDGTVRVVRQMQDLHDNISLQHIVHPGESHEMISEYANTPTWIFAVDGDEIYDPKGLVKLRELILNGELRRWWMILGNVLHCISLDPSKGVAEGYLSPPSRSMTKLYNFQNIKKWSGPCPERLHGGEIEFIDGFSSDDRFMYYERVGWEDSLFRCLHLCFLPRSSIDRSQAGGIVVRQNISEKNSMKYFSRFRMVVCQRLRIGCSSNYKQAKYQRGPLFHKNVNDFLVW